MCVYAHVHAMCTFRGQFGQIGSFHPCGFQISKSDCQAWWQAPLPNETPQWSRLLCFYGINIQSIFSRFWKFAARCYYCCFAVFMIYTLHAMP